MFLRNGHGVSAELSNVQERSSKMFQPVHIMYREPGFIQIYWLGPRREIRTAAERERMNREKTYV